ncbi:MAG TPA: TIM barrel protein [Terriglobia bacterium]|nr:TIM barrel protein [Terriglobia bacterium]
MGKRGRRSFLEQNLRRASLALASALCPSGSRNGREFANSSSLSFPDPPQTAPPFKLGLVTYELAQGWDVDTIIRNCEATRFEGVELRTTHQHGVEPSISKERRAEVRKRFEGSRVRLVSLGSTCEYQSPDSNVVKRNIEETRRFCELARDLGCMGVKVRPNGFPPGSDHTQVLEQIGRALHQCGDIAREQGVEIWLEVHGEETERPPNIRRIMEVCNHSSVGMCWNSNDNDIVEGSVKPSFELLKPWLRSCHINELWRTSSPWGASDDDQSSRITTSGFPQWKKLYPWRELFTLFRSAGYDRYTFAEIPASCEPLRLMHYYRTLWEYHTA